MSVTRHIPGEPLGDPTYLREGYELYLYENKESQAPMRSSEVADPAAIDSVLVVERPPDTHLKMWAFFLANGCCVFEHYVTHQFSEEESVAKSKARECCYMKVAEGHSDDVEAHPNIDTGLSEDDLPEEVGDIVMDLTDAPVISPS